MRKTLATLAILAILSTTGAPASAQQQSTKEQDIRTLIGLTNMDRIAAQMIDLMMPQTRQMILALRPDISKKHLDLLLGEMAEMLRQSAPRFIEAMIPLYEKRFTQAEIRDIVAFYKTPTGRKTLAELPGLMTESMQMGQQWGQTIGRAAAERIRARIDELGI